MAFLTSVAMLVPTASASALSLGVQFQGNFGMVQSEMAGVGKMGADFFRTPLAAGSDFSFSDVVFERAAEQGVRILPVLTGRLGGQSGVPGAAEKDAWSAWIAKHVKRYGHNGSFWNERPSLPYLPVTTWETWNEPNFHGMNGGASIPPNWFGEYLAWVGPAIQNASLEQSGHSTEVIFGGILTMGTEKGVAGSEIDLGDGLDYLKAVYGIPGAANGITGVAIHPYSIYPNSFSGQQRIDALKHVVTEFRNQLSALPGGGSKSLWITELGWPVEAQGAGEAGVAVSPGDQAILLTQAFDYAKQVSGAYDLRGITWYNYRDVPEPGVIWQHRCGLRAHDGTFRPAWHAFRAAANYLPDLFAIELNGTASKTTEAHVLSGRSSYATWGFHSQTPLAETNPSQWRWELADTVIGGSLDGIADLVGVQMNGTSTHQTEVHVLDGATSFKTWGTQYPTPLGETSSSQWQWLAGDSDSNRDGVPDLAGVKMNGTGSKKTEIHILNGNSGFRTWLTQLPTPLAETQPSEWQWLMGDTNADSYPDLIGIDVKNNTTKKNRDPRAQRGQ